MTEDSDVERDVLERLRAICLALPDADEEQAWTGRRWMVRKKTFAHVLSIEDGKPQAHARAVGDAGPITIVTFRSEGAELEALAHAGHPFFYAGWGRDVVGTWCSTTPPTGRRSPSCSPRATASWPPRSSRPRSLAPGPERRHPPGAGTSKVCRLRSSLPMCTRPFAMAGDDHTRPPVGIDHRGRHTFAAPVQLLVPRASKA